MGDICQARILSEDWIIEMGLQVRTEGGVVFDEAGHG